MTEPELHALHDPLFCRAQAAISPGFRLCTPVLARDILQPRNVTFAGVDANLGIFLENGRVTKAGFNMMPLSSSDAIIELLRAKYGEPRDFRLDRMAQLTGKASNHLSTTWVIGDVSLIVSEVHVPRIESTSVMLMPYVEPAERAKEKPPASEDI